ncbi:hypothetical protein MalM14_50710 [Gimesia chilikensis]|nr:hypothetical protein MalM14_50710 [Gimesia chilikensis]
MTEDCPEKNAVSAPGQRAKAPVPKTSEQLARISRLITDGEVSLLKDIADTQIDEVVQLVRKQRRTNLLILISKVISRDLADVTEHR